MNESRLCTIELIEQFLSADTLVAFSKQGDDTERYEHISRVLKRFDYPKRNKRERGVLLRYLRHTSGYSSPQVTRLVSQWGKNRLATVPLAEHYRPPAAPFARKYMLVAAIAVLTMCANHGLTSPNWAKACSFSS